MLGTQLVVVDPEHHGQVDRILGRNREDDASRTGLEVRGQRAACPEAARGLDHRVDAHLLPG